MVLFLSTIFFFVLSAQTVQAEPWGPWSASTEAPVLMMKADRATPVNGSERPERSIAATPFLWLLSFYQKTIGPVVSGRCPMHPTCSRYSVEAIRKHGPIVGIVMTSDRIIHELDEQRYAPLVKVGDRYRFADPVRNNDFWWHSE
jgi:putative component of membrane protein insertase Oxa1/YidC/SpoIIIJ protein YidD